MSSNYHSGWVYLSNPFYSQTQSSYKQFFKLSSDHISSLEQATDDQRIQELAKTYRPLHDDFAQKYGLVNQAKDLRQGMTFKVKQKEDALMQIIGKWDVRLQTVFYQDTVEYKTLLPDKRNPFQNNTREQKLHTLSTFTEKLKNYTELADLQKEVQAFYDDFNHLRELQQQQQTTVSRITEQLKTAHLTAAEQMYKNLGMLIFIFGTNYELAAFFKLSIIRKHLSKKSEEILPEEQMLMEGEIEDDEGVEGELGDGEDLVGE